MAAGQKWAISLALVSRCNEQFKGATKKDTGYSGGE